jgi:hypothetical protein
MQTLITILRVVSDVCFALSILGVRQTVVAMVEGGRHTHFIWHNIKKVPLRLRLGFMARALKLTWWKGNDEEAWSKMLGTRIAQSEVDLYNDAEALGRADPTHPIQKVAAAKAASWAVVAVWTATVTLACRVLLHLLGHFGNTSP